MMPHDDQAQDTSMIKEVLQKIIDEMNGLEASRINPRKPTVADTAEAQVNAEIPMDGEPETDENLDPSILSQLMDKATTADDTGALPEDNEEGLPEDIMIAVKKKKGLLK